MSRNLSTSIEPQGLPEERKHRLHEYFAQQAEDCGKLADSQLIVVHLDRTNDQRQYAQDGRAAKVTINKTIQSAKSGADVIGIAEKLGHDPHRWESSTTGNAIYLLMLFSVPLISRCPGMPPTFPTATA